LGISRAKAGVQHMAGLQPGTTAKYLVYMLRYIWSEREPARTREGAAPFHRVFAPIRPPAFAIETKSLIKPNRRSKTPTPWITTDQPAARSPYGDFPRETGNVKVA
jgi:hypothetical protein